MLLGYQSILQRLCATSTLSVSSSGDQPTLQANNAKLGSEFDLGFISHVQCNVGINENVVRNVLFSAPWMLRLSNLHSFLTQYLPIYANDCTAIYPPLTLQLPATTDNLHAGVIPVIKTTYSGNLCPPSDVAPEASKEMIATRPQSMSSVRSSTKTLLAIAESDLCIQWYRPSLDEYNIQPPQPSGGSYQHSASTAIRWVISTFSLRNHQVGHINIQPPQPSGRSYQHSASATIRWVISTFSLRNHQVGHINIQPPQPSGGSYQHSASAAIRWVISTFSLRSHQVGHINIQPPQPSGRSYQHSAFATIRWVISTFSFHSHQVGHINIQPTQPLVGHINIQPPQPSGGSYQHSSSTADRYRSYQHLASTVVRWVISTFSLHSHQVGHINIQPPQPSGGSYQHSASTAIR